MRTPDWQAEATIDPLPALNRCACGRSATRNDDGRRPDLVLRPKRHFLSSLTVSASLAVTMIGGLYGPLPGGGRVCVHDSVHLLFHTMDKVRRPRGAVRGRRKSSVWYRISDSNR